jgi:hypothetical protein
MMPDRGTNEEFQQIATPPQSSQPSSEDWERYRRARSRSRILGVFYVLVALSTGLTLIVAPWLDQWSFNGLQELSPSIESLWHDPSFRGAVSGLGFANLLIALIETVRLIRH